MRRIPLWLTLVPLVLAVGLYGLLWRSWAADFRAEVVDWLPVEGLSIGGFPYRLEAEIEAPRLTGGGVVALMAEAARARINRGPWQPDLTVIQTERPRFVARVSPAIAAQIEGTTALASINWGEGRLRRLSAVVQAARVALGAGVVPISADTLELHLRERTGDAVPDTSPTRAARGQLVLSGTRLRLGAGDALTMAAEILATGDSRLRGYDRWAQGGTLEVTRLTLADAHGEVARVNATLAPEGRDRLRVAGTVVTACPLRMTGSSQTEYRLRVPVRLAFSGTLDDVSISTPMQDFGNRPRRTKEPACPKILG